MITQLGIGRPLNRLSTFVIVPGTFDVNVGSMFNVNSYNGSLNVPPEHHGEHSENAQRTFSEHSRDIQVWILVIFREHIPTVQKYFKCSLYVLWMLPKCNLLFTHLPRFGWMGERKQLQGSWCPVHSSLEAVLQNHALHSNCPTAACVHPAAQELLLCSKTKQTRQYIVINDTAFISINVLHLSNIR